MTTQVRMCVRYNTVGALLHLSGV